MAHYDRYKKRLDLLSLTIIDSQPFDTSTLDQDILNEPTKNMEYIYYMLSENRIQMKLGSKEHKIESLESLGIQEIEE